VFKPGVRLWAGLLLACLAAMTILQYALPAGYPSFWGFDFAGLGFFRRVLHLNLVPTLSAGWFTIGFRVLICTLYGSYAAMLMASRGLPDVSLRKTLALVAGAALWMAVAFPPTLSSDTFYYVTYARMGPVYHLNPYVNTPGTLDRLNDSAAAFTRTVPSDRRSPITWDIPTVYGPVWTLLASGLVAIETPHLSPSASAIQGKGSTNGGAAPTPHPVNGSLFVQVVTMKLIEALAVCLAAYAGSRVARRLSYNYGSTVLLAIGLNPLFLIEGPGSGHNDMLVMSLVIVCAWLMLDGLPAQAALALGASIGIKFITIAIVPWMLWENRDSLRRPSVAIAVLAALALPTLLGFVPYWHGHQMLAAMASRGAVPVAHHGTVIMARQHETTLAASIIRQAPLLAGYAAITVLVLALRIPGLWIGAWTLLAAMVVTLLMPIQFPWYAIWLWATAACRWNRFHLNLCGMSGAAAFALAWCYSVPDSWAAGNFLFDFGLVAALVMIWVNYKHLPLSAHASSRSSAL
jgi:hypothetical protein